MDPDEMVRDAVVLLFRCFDRLGTAIGTARYFEENHQLFPRRDGWGNIGVAVTWGHLNLARAVAILRNPIYAGIYSYDRYNPREEDPEDGCSGGRIWIEGSHSGYITVEDYRRNIDRLAGNRSFYMGMRGKGSPREGRSLLQGIVFCGVCGRHMSVGYGGGGEPVYTCCSSATGRFCQYINGRHVEPLVEEVFLETLTREEIDLALRAEEKIRERAREMENQWCKRIEAARYEAEKAERRYMQVEPENRLVARTLESEWNAHLEEVERLEKEYQGIREQLPFRINPEQRERIIALALDLPRLWRAPTTQNSQRKQLIRLLIEDVTLRNQENPWSLDMAIRWKTGFVSRHQARRIKPRPHATDTDVVARIEQLYKGHMDREIVDILNAEGYRSGYGKSFTVGRVSHIRKRRGFMKYRSSRNSKPGRSGKGEDQ